MNKYLVVMAGGSGTRFWPKSTSKKPKQFLAFTPGGRTLIAETLARFDGVVPEENRIVVTTVALADLVRAECQANGWPNTQILAEPQGRNTAPCIYWAARVIAEKDPKAVMMVMPSDHVMTSVEKFRGTLKAASDWAMAHEDLVTLGISPDRPETGYGYLRTAVVPGTAGDAGTGAIKVAAFVEKPNLEKAQEFLSAGNYLWNGGMFVWRTDVVLREFDRLMPEMKKAWDESGKDVKKAYPKMTATSIDFGIMEKSQSVATFPLNCGWDDLGGWISVETLGKALGAGRKEGVVLAGDVVGVDSSSNIVDAPGKLVALLGVKDLIVVESGGSILVADKSRAQDIKLIVEKVKAAKPDLA